MRRRRLRHKSLVLCERLAKGWRKDGERYAHVIKDIHGFYFVSFNRDRNSFGGFYYG